MATGHGEPWYADPTFWVAASFAIFMALFLKYLLPKITSGLDSRASAIREQLEQAEKLRAEAEALLATYKKQEKEAAKQAKALVATAEKDAEAIRIKAAEELKQSLARRRAQAEESIQRAEAEAVREIRQQLVSMATDTARKTIAARLESSKEDPAITRAIAAIEQQIH